MINPGDSASHPTAHGAHSHVRISDAERTTAIEALGSHFAEGRLDLQEYDERISSATEARTQQELDHLFTDLPALTKDSALMPMYSAADLERASNSGHKTKAGLLALTTVGSLVLTSVAGSFLWLFLIPTAFILLYMLNVGPASWHAPSPRQLERQRLQAFKAEQKLNQIKRRAIRKEIGSDLTESAMRFAHERIRRR
ncbi:DUF1707 domain-containing protein [Corynebacterium sp. 320]|uniref:DUF1707 domain-containing protein n=1 Tax=Corynebacterium zhongnanshanii TaxID=2768834 RepID=A0ABQ6VEU0_9CORY|nr:MULTISPECIES: DUF1707 domain-containing protein [Corynebacterium]KAB1504204.1 DUF1707 domain-containing protein [Corynebacterium sp. 320]KAB1552696.1 DUF1707 domain-containing protein [Corynebacterium sp. 321]KAB1554086.1 DUF1707 domain-containing protein [Corynebacterium sp. 319]KAB3522942.1 DUF1707 domain-containing protein [Corynebacterium zhongnanshanii]KAB3528340.1 DUF1707 domain-containing protein [Corynebacterium sp. 250]